MKTWVTKELVEYAVGTRYEDYPEEVIEKAKLFILDNIGCALGGSKSVIGRCLTEPFKRMGGSPEATLIGWGTKVPCIHAAFINGSNANALDFDDTYMFVGIGHPGASNIPAALAIAEWRKASGKDIINAVLTGYDVGNRIGLAIQPTQERLSKVWGVGTWQVFNAVVAAGKVLNLNRDQMLHAFGVAGTTAPVPNTQKWGWDMAERPVHWVKEPTGWPCWTGTLAAILAENGFIGNRHVLDGDNGFWIMAGSDRCDYDLMTKGLGDEYVIMDYMNIKRYSACRWQHPALDCIEQIRDENNLKPSDVKEVIINAYEWVKSQEVHDPVNIVDAQFSIPYTAAMVLMGFKPGPAWYAEDNLGAPNIKDLAHKVSVVVDPDLEKIYWEKEEVTSRVDIITQTGERHTKFVDKPRGDARNPLSNEEVEDKFRTQASYVLEEASISRAVNMIYDLEDLDNIDELMGLLTG